MSRLSTIDGPARILSNLRALSVLLDGDHVAEAEPGTVQSPIDAADRAPSHAQALCRPARRNGFPGLDLEHDAGGDGLDRHLAGFRHDACLSPGATELPRQRHGLIRGAGALSRPA